MTKCIALIYGLMLAAPVGMAADQVRAPSKAAARVKTHVMDTSGKQIGTATFVSSAGGVIVTVDVQGLPPGLHGIHIHEKGLCNPEEGFASAGGHFTAPGKKHGLLSKTGPHAGDLPNLKVRANGTGHLKAKLKATSLNPADPGTLLQPSGTALIIHAGPDDQVTDPSGKSGDRIACALISPAQG